jgi:hypothetical protein
MFNRATLRDELAPWLPANRKPIDEILQLAESHDEVREWLERRSSASKAGRRRVALLKRLRRASEDSVSVLTNLADPTEADLAKEVAETFDKPSTGKRRAQRFGAFRGEAAKFAETVQQMLPKRKRGNPGEPTRHWLERGIALLLYEAGVPLGGTRGRPSVVIQVITTVVVHLGYSTPAEMRTHGTRRVLKMLRELDDANKRGELREFREFTPFECVFRPR